MENDFGKRLALFIAHLDISIRQFEMNCKIGTGAIGKVINHGTDLSKETLDKIAKKYPLLNMNWLERNEGNMLASPVSNKPKSDSSESEELKLRIKQLEEQNYKLTEQLIETVKKLR